MAKIERLEIRVDPSFVLEIDQWRASQSDLPSRSEFIRRLVEQSLSGDQGKRLFEMTRHNVLAAAISQNTQDRIDNSYAYAWHARVYPLHHKRGVHSAFDGHFDVNRTAMEELSGFLDEQWREEQVPSFYDLEDRYDVRSGTGAWNREGLIDALRYWRIHELFDEPFWAKILTPVRHPSEARMITSKFRRTEISLM